ncbi:CRISPR-associated protein Cas2 [Candidatus Hakubella thermalkaliphila]|uniref:CRISPR-associated endoribonuclease Cas2 n=1 Tax=Candidatus Hakubella thermalkaliphila TaxID=2754717 RepID=A0A6V8NUH9_9ACTN|nr:CRISPR-associated protein Cas2 [Candidatus Hakubella thermalkaliphila]
MQTLVIYDIPDDKKRLQISERCKDWGLTRIQYSAFIGDLNHNRRDELFQKLRRTLGREEGNIGLHHICDKDLKLAWIPMLVF